MALKKQPKQWELERNREALRIEGLLRDARREAELAKDRADEVLMRAEKRYEEHREYREVLTNGDVAWPHWPIAEGAFNELYKMANDRDLTNSEMLYRALSAYRHREDHEANELERSNLSGSWYRRDYPYSNGLQIADISAAAVKVAA